MMEKYGVVNDEMEKTAKQQEQEQQIKKGLKVSHSFSDNRLEVLIELEEDKGAK